MHKIATSCLVGAGLLWAGPLAAAGGGALPLGALARLGSVDERYQSYNIEMVEVTGGRFWAPYGSAEGEMYRQRPPIDLTNPRLVQLARALGPAYVRVSGTWANNTYLPAEGEVVSAPPEGFRQVLQRQQWRHVVGFAKATDARIVTSFAVSTGTRDAAGHWQSAQAQRLVDLTRASGGQLAAAEFFNEPNMPGAAQGMPAGYDAAHYAEDFRLFRSWARQAAPDMLLLGTGGVSEASMLREGTDMGPLGKTISSRAMLSANPGMLDGVSYHFYGTVSQRCAKLGQGTAVKADALKASWLDATLPDAAHYAALRDAYEPGKPLWNTETGQAACGGSPWASGFLDTFRYLNQLGALAQKGVQVVIHNTLAASDYALLDTDTLAPRPSYWAAVLWRRVMGRTVLASPASPSADLRLYAQCLRGQAGGVGLLALNTGDTAQTLRPGPGARVWLMTGQPTDTRQIKVNGQTPAMLPNGSIAHLDGAPVGKALVMPARSIAFVAAPRAGNPACTKAN